MKKIFLLLLLLNISGCIAQETVEPEPIIKGDFIVSDIVDDKATLTNRGRFYKAAKDDFIVGREYYVEMIVTDCDKCFHKQVVIKFKATSDRQNALDRAKRNKDK